MTTLIRLYSDLHLECGKFKVPKHPQDAETILILNGDIGERGKPREFVERCTKQFKFVLYILGNHEFYGGEYHAVKQYWKDREAENENLFVLDNEVFVHNDVRILGATMWTDLTKGDFLAMEYARRNMNDYHVIDIYNPGESAYKVQRKLMPDDTVKFHAATIAFFKEELAKEFEGTTIVCTHFSPSPSLAAGKYAYHPLNPAFHANCDYMFTEYKIDYWLFGHTHTAINVKLADTYVMSNPRGYVGYESQEEVGFDENFVLMV